MQKNNSLITIYGNGKVKHMEAASPDSADALISFLREIYHCSDNEVSPDTAKTSVMVDIKFLCTLVGNGQESMCQVGLYPIAFEHRKAESDATQEDKAPEAREESKPDH